MQGALLQTGDYNYDADVEWNDLSALAASLAGAGRAYRHYKPCGRIWFGG